MLQITWKYPLSSSKREAPTLKFHNLIGMAIYISSISGFSSVPNILVAWSPTETCEQDILQNVQHGQCIFANSCFEGAIVSISI